MEEENTGLVEGPDGITRCAWHGNLPDYLHYHDHEWGRPVVDDRRLFEKLCLEGFQSGLSWLTILRKRENFRRAFARLRLRARRGIRRGRRRAPARGCRHRPPSRQDRLDDQQCPARPRTGRGGRLARGLLLAFEPGAEQRPAVLDRATLMAMPTTPESTRSRRTCKKRGWTFVGPTTVYAFMQAMGMVNDHLEGCVCREEVEKERARFVRPV